MAAEDQQIFPSPPSSRQLSPRHLEEHKLALKLLMAQKCNVWARARPESVLIKFDDGLIRARALGQAHYNYRWQKGRPIFSRPITLNTRTFHLRVDG